MSLRKVRPRGRGKNKQDYWELVESYRSAKGSRQRTRFCLTEGATIPSQM